METESALENWRLTLNNLEKKYYTLRTEFYNTVERYYRQNPYGDYVQEENLIKMLKELDDIRTEFKKISKENYPDTKGLGYKGRANIGFASPYPIQFI